MTNREILDKDINLDNSCLTKAEKKEVRGLIYKYRDAFSLRDKIGMCPNIEVEIDMTDKTQYFYKTFPCKGGRQDHLGQRNEKTMLFRNLKGRLFYLYKPSHACQ